jgi:hypothetical protein
MKNKKSDAVLAASPDAPSPTDVADSVIEDLNQQDVLPPDEGDVIPDMGEPEESDMPQAGSWDNPAADLGHRASKLPLEDEVKATEGLVNMGVDEADEELRELDEQEEEKEEG